MQREESIYNLIPRIIPVSERPAQYVSKHNPKIKPTGSTFGCRGSGRIEGSNLGKPTNVEKKKLARSFGNVTKKPDPKAFITKGERCKNPELQEKPRKFNYSGARKPKLIQPDERPMMGLKSSKDYVTSNAVETILAAPGNRARTKKQVLQYKSKVDYGKVPAYLHEVKREIEEENQLIDAFVRENQKLQEEEEGKVEPMDEDERDDLINALKAKWDHVNKQYQKMGHIVVFDTQGKVRRKETLENQLTQIEKDINLLERGQVLISS